MLVYYFLPFIVSNRYLLFWVSNGHNSVTVQNRTRVYMNCFDHKDLGNHLLQLCPKVVKHPVYSPKGQQDWPLNRRSMGVCFSVIKAVIVIESCCTVCIPEFVKHGCAIWILLLQYLTSLHFMLLNHICPIPVLVKTRVFLEKSPVKL